MNMLTVIFAFFIVVFILWRFLFFFRNPDRKIPYDDNSILSPADGFIVYVKKVIPGQNILSVKKGTSIMLDDLMFIDNQSLLHKPGWLIGICMSPFDVHYNRAPISGEIVKIRHDFPTDKRLNFDMFPALQNMFFNIKPYTDGCEYVITNERASYIISNKERSVYVTQIADNWIKKIVTYKNEEAILQGDTFGLIRMGSQVDIFIPDVKEDISIKVKERERVKAGTSLIATLIQKE